MKAEEEDEGRRREADVWPYSQGYNIVVMTKI